MPFICVMDYVSTALRTRFIPVDSIQKVGQPAPSSVDFLGFRLNEMCCGAAADLNVIQFRVFHIKHIPRPN